VGAAGALDTVLTNALILDYWGVVKADIGIKDKRIVGIGKAGNPDVMDGVDQHMVVGVSAPHPLPQGLPLPECFATQLLHASGHRPLPSHPPGAPSASARTCR